MKYAQLTKPIRILVLPLAALALVACEETSTESTDISEASEASEASEEATPAAAAYPLTVCVVSGEPLGSMGDPVVYDHEGTTVKFCCKSCIPDFEADPAPYLAKLDADPQN